MLLSYTLVHGLTLRPLAQAGHAPRPRPIGHQLILVPHPPDGGLGDLVTQLSVEMFHGRGVAVLQGKLPDLGSYLVTVLDITTSTGLFGGFLLHFLWQLF